MDRSVFPDNMHRDAKIFAVGELAQTALVEVSNLKSEFEKLKTNTANSKKTHRKRGLNKAEAANFIGVSLRKFDAMLKSGKMPKPRLLIDDMRHGENVKKIWDIRELDDYFDQLPKEAERNEWDDVF